MRTLLTDVELAQAAEHGIAEGWSLSATVYRLRAAGFGTSEGRLRRVWLELGGGLDQGRGFDPGSRRVEPGG